MSMMQVTADNRDRVRSYYLSLCEQGRANFLYDNMIGGAKLGLDPGQYPKTKPMHRTCICGNEPKQAGSMNSGKKSCYAYCPHCGCRSVNQVSPLMAWRAWDRNVLENDENYTIWEAMK